MKETVIRLKKGSSNKKGGFIISLTIIMILISTIIVGVVLVYHQMDTYANKLSNIESSIDAISTNQNNLQSDIIDINSILKLTTTENISKRITYQALGSDVSAKLDNLNSPLWDKTDNSITNLTFATEDDFNKMIDNIINSRDLDENNPMRGKGYLLKKIEDDYGISGNAILSIITWETNFCTECPAYNNVCCVRSGVEYENFNSIDECILYLGKLLDSYINDYDLHTWGEIGNRYCDYRWSINIPSTILAYNDMMWDIKFKFNDDGTNE